MGWFDDFYSFTNAIDEKLWYIKYQLKDWIDNIADVAVANAGKWHDILYHTWDEVKDYAVTAAAVVYDMLEDKIDDVHTFAISEANNAYKAAVAKIDDVYDDINSLKNTMNSNVGNLGRRIDSLSSTVGGIDIPGVSTVRSWLASDFRDIKKIAKSYTDKAKGELLASMSSMDRVAGAARVALVKSLDAAIDLVEREAKSARNVIKSNLDKSIDLLEKSSKSARALLEKTLKNSIDVLEKSSKNARGLLEKTLNNAMDKLEREAKQAREVIEGTLIQMIEAAEDALERAMADLERTFRGLLDVLGDRVEGLEGWVKNATKWFDKELNKYQGRVVTWIVDGFEGILDRVFK